MVTMILCDRCARAGERVPAEFRVTFERIWGKNVEADHPMDLCKMHYETIWEDL